MDVGKRGITTLWFEGIHDPVEGDILSKPRLFHVVLESVLVLTLIGVITFSVLSNNIVHRNYQHDIKYVSELAANYADFRSANGRWPEPENLEIPSTMKLDASTEYNDSRIDVFSGVADSRRYRFTLEGDGKLFVAVLNAEAAP